MARAKADPLEMAKVVDATVARDDATANRTQWAAPPAPRAPDPPPTPPVAPAPPRVYYVVEEDTRHPVSLSPGYTDRPKKGARIDPAGFGGEAGIERLKRLGVKLRRVEAG